MIRRAGRRAATLLPPLVAGVLVAASLPPAGFWPLAPLGVALLARSLAGASWRRRLAVGFAAGAGQFGIGCYWAMQFTAAGFVALVAVEAAFIAVASICTPPGRSRLVALPAMLVLAEWARDRWPLGGLPIAGIPLGEVGGPLLPLVRLGGPLLLVAAVALVGCAIDSLVAGAPRSPVIAVACLAAVVVLTAVASLAPAGGAGVRRYTVLAIQGGGRRGVSALDVPAAAVLTAQLEATARAPHGATLAVWPEDAVSLAAPLARSPIDELLAGTARALDATFVVGVTTPAGPAHFVNEAVVYGPSGRYVGAYEKVHPVPFGEYVPFRALLAHFVSLAAVPRDALVGHGSGMVTTPAGRLALLISFETFFTARGRSGVGAGGELLVVPTNTASYVTSQIPDEELAASRLQAVAEGRDLVQAASTGVSAVVSNTGRLLASSGLGRSAIVEGNVELRTGATVYDRVGDLPVVAVAVVVAVGCWWRERRRVSRGSRRRRVRRLASRTAPC